MPRINIGAVFSHNKSASVPVVRVPKSVKQSLCIDKAAANGSFKIEPVSGACMYDQCYLFEDINYINKDGDKKKNTLLELMTLFRSMDEPFKITVASEQQNMDAYMEEVFRPIHGREYPLVERGIGTWINQKLEEGTRDISRILLLTVTCRANSFEEAATYFGTLDTSLQIIFRSLRSRLYRLNGEERLLILQQILRGPGKGIHPAAPEPGNDGWKNQILPASIKQDTDYMVIDNQRYVSVLFGHDYGQSLNEEKLMHSLTDVLFPVYVTLDMKKVPKRVVRERLLNAHANNEKLISQERSRNFKNKQFGAGTSYQLGKKKEELEEAMDQVDDNDEDGLFLGLLVMVCADSLEELTQRVDILKQKAVSNNYMLDPYFHRQLKALNTVLPIGGRQVDHMRFFYTSSAAAFQPFYANDLHDPDGIVYGLNLTTKHLLQGNRLRLPAPHGFIVGHSGGGKSYLIKETEIAQTLLFTEDDVIILDPNNEQEKFITSLKGGQYFDFTPQSKIYMNPFEIPQYVMDGDESTKNKFVAKITEYAVSFCAAVMRNILVTQVHMNHIGRVVRTMYADYFAEKSPLGKKKKLPTWRLLREMLKEQIDKVDYPEDRRMLLDIVDSLEEYTIGVYDMFAHPSNLDIHSRLVGFGLRNIPEAVWEPAMLTIMHFLTMRIDFNQDERIALRLIVDETQVLCEKETTAAQLLYAVETYRKVGAVVTLAAQNLTYILENRKMRDMFSNCPYKCFFDQGGLDAANLAQIQELSTSEFHALEENRWGCGVMVWGNNVYLFDALMSKDNELYPYFNTNFHEQAEEKRRKTELMKEG